MPVATAAEIANGLAFLCNTMPGGHLGTLKSKAIRSLQPLSTAVPGQSKPCIKPQPTAARIRPRNLCNNSAKKSSGASRNVARCYKPKS